MTPKTVQTFAGHASLQVTMASCQGVVQNDEIESLAKETAR
jgi:hypothetical protein